MDTEKSDQQQFDEQVNKTGKLVLEVLAGVGIVAAVTMSIAAMVMSSNGTRSTNSVMPMSQVSTRATTLPTTASVQIEHATRGCHTMIVDGTGPGSPSATIRLAAGGSLQIQNNDVMPHKLVRVSGPNAQLVTPAMNHMGARSTATFATPGTYSLSTKAGEDYTSGIKTIGPDNTLRLKVVVAAS